MSEEVEFCPCCGKKMQQVYDKIAKKKTGYLWHCECLPDDMDLSIG